MNQPINWGNLQFTIWFFRNSEFVVVVFRKGTILTGKKKQRFGCTIPVMINMLLGYSCHNSRIMSLQGPIKKHISLFWTHSKLTVFLMVNTWKYRGIWRFFQQKKGENISSELGREEYFFSPTGIRCCSYPISHPSLVQAVGGMTWWHGDIAVIRGAMMCNVFFVQNWLVLVIYCKKYFGYIYIIYLWCKLMWSIGYI